MSNKFSTWSQLNKKASETILDYKPLILKNILNTILRKLKHELIFNGLTDTPLNSKKHLKPISNDYKKYLIFLIECNIITNTGLYSKGYSSKSYSINPYYFESHFLDHILGNGGVGGAGVEGVGDVEVGGGCRSFELSSGVYYNPELTNFLLYSLNDISLDFENAVMKAEELKLNRLIKPDVKYKKGKLVKLNPHFQFMSDYSNLSNLNKGIFNFSIDNYGRLHTNITGLSKHYRQFITIDSKPIFSIDVANCQPCFLILLCNINFWADMLAIPKTTSDYTITLSDLNYHIDLTNVHSDLIELLNIIQSQPDFILFKDYAIKGVLFQKLGEILFGITDTITTEQKKNIKDSVNLVLFSKNSYERKNKIIFRKHFPSIEKLCRIIKANEHNELACLLQRIESHIILSLIGGRISRELNPIPFITIHDNCATTAEHLEHLKFVMSEEFEKALGFIPFLRTETW